MQYPDDFEPMTPELRARVAEALAGIPAAGHYTPPAPPPADMPVDPDKWRRLDRKTRRALLRHHRKVTG